ncbi:MAG: HipA domain-containing protein [Azoarcus sp.]|jgi:serine/threonine-protein kinase HipA|nr:HipA domain-containing protein [Azoarcus sp.]
MSQRILKVGIGNAGLEVGTLWFEAVGGREHSSFQYSAVWLEHPRRFAIAPMLPLTTERRFFKAQGEQGSPLPAPVADTTPDSWGRGIIRKDTRFNKKGPTEPLTEFDFLTAVDDFSRVGALRFRETEEGSPFLATGEGGRHCIPPLLHLDQLGKAIASAESDDPDMVALRRLRQMGTTLGGARPKCSVIDNDGSLAIAKFTSRLDMYAVERAEVLALRLARLCGIDTPEARIESSDGLPVAIIKRFDRSAQGRIPFVSAQTMLGAPSATGATYADICDALRQYTASPRIEMRKLFRRVGFNILVSNVDDHLKNHGFLYASDGKWRLSPAFDVNPAPERFRELKTAIADPTRPEASIELLVDHAFYFEMSADEAVEIVRAMADVIAAKWQELAREIGMSRAERDDYRPAFEHAEADYALRKSSFRAE